MITNEIPPPFDDSTNQVSNKTNILISHYAVHHNFISLNKIHALTPTIIFSSHNHKSNEIVEDSMTHKYSRLMPLKKMRTFDIDTLKQGNKVLEIQVTSCSYRMGTLSIGYAQAIFDDGKLKYSPMFVISRFYQLCFYLISLFAIIIFNLCRKTQKTTMRYERLI